MRAIVVFSLCLLAGIGCSAEEQLSGTPRKKKFIKDLRASSFNSWLNQGNEKTSLRTRTRTKREVRPENTVAANFLNRSNRVIRVYETNFFGFLRPRFELRPNEPKAVWLVPGSYWTARDYKTGVSMLMNCDPWFIGRWANVGKTIDLKIRAPKRLQRVAKNEAKISINEKYVKVLVIGDSSITNYYGKRNVGQYLATLIGMVGRIYKDKSLDVPVNIIATSIHILEKETESFKFTKDDPDGNVKNACQYADTFWRKGGQRKDFDFAVVVTRKDIGPSGYAAMYTMCTGESCALVKENGFASGFVIAHELGHALGIDHDGIDGECVDDKMKGSIMAPKVYSKHNQFHWSSCSRKALKENIRFFPCLNNRPLQVDPKFKEIQTALAGQTYSRIHQCKLYLGNQATDCGRAREFGSCNYLYCRRFVWSYCSPVYWVAPLDGSVCQRNRWCIKGKCTLKAKSSPENGNWGSWGKSSSCQGICVAGVQYRNRKCNNPPPSNGGKNCTGADYELTVCKLRECNGFDEKHQAREQHCASIGKGWKILDSNTVEKHLSHSDVNCNFEGRSFCGWRNDNQDNRDWQINSGPTPSRGTGPSFDHTKQNDAGHYIYFEASWVNEREVARLIGPRLLGKTFCLSFFYHMYATDDSTMGSLYVYILHKNNSAMEIWSRKGNIGNQWEQSQITVESYDSFKIVIEASRGRGYQSDIALDDIKITPGHCNTIDTSAGSCKIPCFSEDQQRVMTVTANNGTPCHTNSSLDVCFNGICQQVGCDYRYGSSNQRDQCGVCNGKGDTCSIIEGKSVIGTQKVLQEVLTVPYGASEFVITKRSRSQSFLGLFLEDKNATNVFNTDGRRWPSGTYTASETSFHYTRSNTSESISCNDPVKKNFTVAIFTPIRHPGNNIDNRVEVTFRIKLGKVAGERFAYVFTGWSSCSSPCGRGYKNPVLACKEIGSNKVVRDVFCIGKRKPIQHSRRCNSRRCSSKWQALGWNTCSSACGIGYQKRSVICTDYWGYPVPVNNCRTPKPVTKKECYQKPCPNHVFITGAWSNCSESCGEGVQSRQIYCHNEQSPDQQFRFSSLSSCPNEYPVNARLCNRTKCSQYFWGTEDFGGCSASCGGGTQIKMLQCQEKISKRVVSDTFCKKEVSESRPPLLVPCNTYSCDNNVWQNTEFNGAYCVNLGTGQKVPEVLCKGTRPDRKRIVSDIKAHLKELLDFLSFK